ncbi:MAG: FIST N-terminal domain-containing protein [Candidatus Competibacteraceae bacterium]
MGLNSNCVTLGQARHADPFTAAQRAALQARSQLPASETPGWALAFAGGQHDPKRLLSGLRAVLGDIPIVGGCVPGVITAAAATLTGYECGLLLFPASLNPVNLFVVDGLEQDEAVAGRRLGETLRKTVRSDTTVLLFYDSVRSGPPPILHVGSRLMDGLYEGLGELRPSVIGAGTLGDMEWSKSYIFDGQQPCKHAAVAVVLPHELASHVIITHGCLPASDFLEITRIDGARVLELDRRTALTVAAERLGIPREQLAVLRLPQLLLTLGEKYGDPFAPFDDSQYVNRLVMAVDPDDDALILCEADFHVGTRIQLMAIDPERMIESAQRQTRALLDQLAGQSLVFGLYIDCAGRSMAFSGMEEDETTPVREQVGALCPLLGFYSGVEIAPLLGRARPLDWTGVLALFTRSTA